MNLEIRKRRLDQESPVLRFMMSASTKGSALRERSGVLCPVGRLMNLGYARIFDTYTAVMLLAKRVLVRSNPAEMARQITDGADSDLEAAGRLCRWVFEHIAYARSMAWLRPADVLRLGYGDCRCQARLIWALLTERGLNSRIRVGIVGYRTGSKSVHSWTELSVGNDVLICDPTRSPDPISAREYGDCMGGVLDCTTEYAMKNSDFLTLAGKEDDKNPERRWW